MAHRPLKLVAPLPRLLGPGEVIAGAGSLSSLRALPAARVAVIATRRAAADANVAQWIGAPASYAIEHVEASWPGEPSLADLEQAVAALRAFRPDWIVAIGGGSVLDGAKLCWARYEHPHFPLERLDRPFALPALRRLARFVAVPTSAGTGSESSSAAVFTDRETGRKIPAVTHDFLPDIAILDPRLTVDLPPEWTAMTAFDALGHALEGYVSALDNPLVDRLAEGAIADILESLPRILESPRDLDARARLQIAACHAGYVQNLRLVGIAHAVAHQLGAWKIPHAFAVMTLLPYGMEFVSREPRVRERYARVARMCGLSDADALIAKIRELPRSFGLADRLGRWAGADARLSSEQAAVIAAAALDDPIARFFPAAVSSEQMTELVLQAW
jgi:alcohol dehydrogenase class IV